jgi:hypothetical protein
LGSLKKISTFNLLPKNRGQGNILLTMRRISNQTFSLIVAFIAPYFSLAQHQKPVGSPANKILIANLQLDKSGTAYIATLQNVRIIEGSLKQEPAQTKPWTEGDLICLIPVAHPNNSDTFYLGKPFQTRYEYPGEDGTLGTITRNTVYATMLLRIPFREDAAKIGFELFGPDRSFIRIAELPLVSTQPEKQAN